MDKNEFITKAKAKRKENIEPVMLEALAKMLKDDLRYFDAHYIQDRTLEIIEKTLEKLTFKSDTILKARRAFLDVLLDGAKEQMFGFEDDYALAKENVKIKEEKEKAKEAMRKIERLRDKLPKDSTEQRDMECEPICQMIAARLLSKELILKDEDFVNGCIEMDNDLLMGTLYRPLSDEFFNQLVSSLDDSYRRANEINWGVSREKIRMSQVDNRLKNK